MAQRGLHNQPGYGCGRLSYDFLAGRVRRPAYLTHAAQAASAVDPSGGDDAPASGSTADTSTGLSFETRGLPALQERSTNVFGKRPASSSGLEASPKHEGKRPATAVNDEVLSHPSNPWEAGLVDAAPVVGSEEKTGVAALQSTVKYSPAPLTPERPLKVDGVVEAVPVADSLMKIGVTAPQSTTKCPSPVLDFGSNDEDQPPPLTIDSAPTPGTDSCNLFASEDNHSEPLERP